MITSKGNPQYKKWLKLGQKKYRQQEGLFLVEGPHLVEEAQKAGVLQEVLVCEDSNFGIETEATILRKDLFARLVATVNSSGVIGVCRVQEPELDHFNRLLLVDGVQDPGNLGTLIRSALAFGFDGIVLSEDTVDIYNEKVVRSTQGAIFTLPILRRELAEFISDYQTNGGQALAATLNKDALPLSAIETAPKMAFVVGNEGAGVRPAVVSACNGSVVVEMSTAVESLNVGVAGSILMHHFRQV